MNMSGISILYKGSLDITADPCPHIVYYIEGLLYLHNLTAQTLLRHLLFNVKVVEHIL